MLTNQPTSLSITAHRLPTSKKAQGYQQQHLMNIWLGSIAAAGAINELTHSAVTLASGGHIPPQTTQNTALCATIQQYAKNYTSDDTCAKKPSNLQILHKRPAVIT
jgi:hypothetical protein